MDIPDFGMDNDLADWKICVTREPADSFYKDEGGKSNHLIASFSFVDKTCDKPKKKKRRGAAEEEQSVKSRLVEFAKRVEKLKVLTAKPQIPPIQIDTHPWRINLCYESKRIVEDENEIFRVIGLESHTSLDDIQKNGTYEFSVKYRIEKVSRRKDGKKFCVRCEFNDDSLKGAAVYTSSVNVLSKRKVRQGRNNKDGLSNSKRERKNISLKVWDSVLQRLSDAEKNISGLEELVKSQAKKIKFLEDRLGEESKSCYDDSEARSLLKAEIIEIEGAHDPEIPGESIFSPEIGPFSSSSSRNNNTVLSPALGKLIRASSTSSISSVSFKSRASAVANQFDFSVRLESPYNLEPLSL